MLATNGKHDLAKRIERTCDGGAQDTGRRRPIANLLYCVCDASLQRVTQDSMHESQKRNGSDGASDRDLSAPCLWTHVPHERVWHLQARPRT